MKLRHIFPIALLALCACRPQAHEFFYELRAPKTLKFDPTNFRVDVVTENSASSTQITNLNEAGDFVVFAASCLIFDGQTRRALVVGTGGQPEQVFRLTFPRSPKAVDWTKWQRPDYIEKTDAVLTFMQDAKQCDRSTNVPSDSFELRFKMADWK